jgi:thymidylate synthase ThyX
MGYAAKILADSISTVGHRLTTFEVTFPRIVLAEVNTHRMLSRNSASSRAIPVAKKIAQVESDPFVPEAFGKNQKGMQHGELLNDEVSKEARFAWGEAKRRAIKWAGELAKLEVHKQLANRVLEPFAWHTAIITATDWSNFFNLRVNPAAQGEFRTCAEMMKELYDSSCPIPVRTGGWHLPLLESIPMEDTDGSLVEVGESFWLTGNGFDPAKVSAARCGRVSFLTHDGKRDPTEDTALYERLLSSGHMSPLEHPARPMTEHELKLFERPRYRWIRGEWHPEEPIHYCGNLNGWVSLRAMVPGEEDILGYRKANL